MLSKNRVVRRKAIESLYDGLCTIIGNQKVVAEDGTTEFEEVVVCKDQPCRLSFGSSKTQAGETATGTMQTITLFLAPEIVVPAGSKITVTQNGRTTEYECSNTPEVYSAHQQISLSLKDRWA
jgi:hypothetical protein